MSNGTSQNYDYKLKRDWSNWAYNRILERLSVPAKDAVVLYLAGKEDLDRPKLLRSGFRANNLISIEKCEAVAQNLRSRGILTIYGDAVDAVASWSKLKVDVLFVDACGPLSQKMIMLAELLSLHPCFCDSVLAFNLLAGRDDVCKIERGEVEKARVVSRDHFGTIYGGNIPFRHRGGMIYQANASAVVRSMEAACASWKSQCQIVESLGEPSIAQYISKSSNQRFDSCVWKNVSVRRCASMIGAQITSREESEYFTAALSTLNDGVGMLNSLAPQIAAVKAHRTMRANSP